MDIFKIRDIIKKVLGVRGVSFFSKIYFKHLLIKNFIIDYRIYKKYSTIFNKKSKSNIEAEITLRYHSLEKGFAHDKMRYSFGKKRVIELISMVKSIDLKNNYTKEQIKSAIHSLTYYYRLHEKKNIDISDYFSKEDYNYISSFNNNKLKGVKHHNSIDYFKDIDKRSFKEFSLSRSSVRSFKEEKISKERIEKVINLANNAPSVCNRQASRVFLLEDKDKIDQTLKIQKGLRGYESQIKQLMVLTVDRSFFYTVGERYQYYIDGGIYLMNLLYALHFYKIAACPAHWAQTEKEDRAMMNLLNIPESYKVICIVPIGIPKDNFKTTLSLRKKHNETLTIIS